MNIDEMTLNQLKQIQTLFGGSVPPSEGHPWQIGKTYLIRTVTMIDVGILTAVFPNELVIEKAGWIADTGRFSEALKTGDFSEVEPFPDGPIIIGRGSLIDATVIDPITLVLK
ncbi:MAG: hypothetical protein L3J33_03345 [Rhodobacteraceae bacterium]|nr:hypothetical protein [Paracoccaceae bacterium]